jgi:hypothetical protein
VHGASPLKKRKRERKKEKGEKKKEKKELESTLKRPVAA